MAISQAMSNPSDWPPQSYHTDFLNFSQTETPPTTVAGGGATTSAASRINKLSPDQGRVAKPLRRRSRTSRRIPTTLLNTDTANFRAMVQRFTGGPSDAYPAGSQVPNGAGGLNFMEHVAATSGAPASGFSVQYYPNQELQHQHMMFMMGGGGGGGGPAAPAPGSASGNENRSYDNYML